MLSGGAIIYHRLVGSHLPDVPWYLLLGVLIGPVAHVVRVGMNTASFDFILQMGALFVLFEGGRGLPLVALKAVWSSVASLASLGVLISVAVMALVAHFVFGLPSPLGMMLGILLANTDPASVIPIMNTLNLPRTIRTTMEAESAFNDVVSAVFIGVATAYIIPSQTPHTLIYVTLAALASVALALVIGGLTGKLGSYLMMITAQPLFAVYMAVPILIWGLSQAFSFNIYLAAFVAGLLWSRRAPIALDAQWVASVGAIARIMVFMGLGLSVPMATFRARGMMGLGLALILIFVSRPLAVMGALSWLRRWTPRQLALMMWVRESGVISAALAIHVAAQFPRWRAEILAPVFVSILITVAVQAPTTSWVVRRLGLHEPPMSPERRS